MSEGIRACPTTDTGNCELRIAGDVGEGGAAQQDSGAAGGKSFRTVRRLSSGVHYPNTLKLHAECPTKPPVRVKCAGIPQTGCVPLNTFLLLKRFENGPAKSHPKNIAQSYGTF